MRMRLSPRRPGRSPGAVGDDGVLPWHLFAQLGAQGLDVGVHRAVVGLAVAAPHRVEQRSTAVDACGRGQQGAQQAVLQPRQRQPHAAIADALIRRVALKRLAAVRGGDKAARRIKARTRATSSRGLKGLVR